MADVIKNSFDETNLHSKVIFQKGRDIIDYELNEAQDNLRVLIYRSLSEGTVGTAPQVAGSNDSGYLVTGTGAANQVSIGTGFLFVDGIPIIHSVGSTLSGFVNADAVQDRIDVVYISINEQEIADPAQMAELGETTKRQQLTPTLAIATGIPGTPPAAPAIPADTALEIWEGGTHYFKLAEVYRTAGSGAIINLADVTDYRLELPPTILNKIVRQIPTAAVGKIIDGNWTITVGDGVTTFGDFNGVTAIDDAMSAWLELNPGGGGAIPGLKVLAKAGTYSFATNFDWSGRHIEIIGESFADTSVQVFLSLGGTIWDELVSGQFIIRLENVEILSAPSIIRMNPVNRRSPITFGSKVVFERCSFPAGSQLTFYAPDVAATSSSPEIIFEAVECFFYGDTTVDSPILIIDDGSGSSGQLGGFQFIRCHFNQVTSGACIQVQVTDVTAISTDFFYVKRISFNQCFFRTAPVGGAAVNPNCGVLAALQVAGAKQFVFEDLTFLDCTVRGGSKTAGGTLLNLWIAPDGGSQQSINELNLKIIGGTWLVDASTTPVPTAHFYIGYQFVNPVAGMYLCGDIVIEGVTFGYTVDAGNQVNMSAPAYAETHTHCISCKTLFMRDVRYDYGRRLGNFGEFFIATDRGGVVDGVRVIANVTSSGAAPVSRIAVQGASPSDDTVLFTLNSVMLVATATQLLATTGIVQVLPPRVIAAGGRSIVRLEKCSVGGNDAAGGGPGISCTSGAYPGFTLEIIGCNISEVRDYGIYHTGEGSIRIRDTTVFDVDGTPGVGIFLRPSAAVARMQISGCYVTDCASYGMHIYPNGFTDWLQNGPIVIGNIINNNNGGTAASKTQVEIGTTSDDNIGGEFIGNSLWASGGAFIGYLTYKETAGGNSYMGGIVIDAGTMDRTLTYAGLGTGSMMLNNGNLSKTTV